MNDNIEETKCYIDNFNEILKSKNFNDYFCLETGNLHIKFKNLKDHEYLTFSRRIYYNIFEYDIRNLMQYSLEHILMNWKYASNIHISVFKNGLMNVDSIFLEIEHKIWQAETDFLAPDKIVKNMITGEIREKYKLLLPSKKKNDIYEKYLYEVSKEEWKKDPRVVNYNRKYILEKIKRMNVNEV